MILLEDHKSDAKPTRDRPREGTGDLPPAYDALSLHRPTNSDVNQCTSLSVLPSPVAGSSRDPLRPDPAKASQLALDVLKSPSSLPTCKDTDIPTSSRRASAPLTQTTRARKNTSWFSLLPFVSSFSAKRVRQSVMSIVSDLVVPPSRTSHKEQEDVHEILASLAQTCTEHKISLSTILQETFIGDHTPMYWAVFHYRQELLVALLVHSRPLSIQTISDIRRACLVSSNQALFHALRVCRPPFHKTDGIQVPSLRTGMPLLFSDPPKELKSRLIASENLLVGNRPLDEIHIQRTNDQGLIVSFDILLWQKRMRGIGQVGIEFIASGAPISSLGVSCTQSYATGRMWSVTFFSTDPSLLVAPSRRSKKGTNTWHVMISLLESSPPTFFDSQLIVDIPSPIVPESIQTPRIREARSMMFLTSRDKQYQSQSSIDDYSSDGRVNLQSSRDHDGLAPSEEHSYASSSSFTLPPPTHPLRGSYSSPRSSTAAPPIIIRLGCGKRQLGRRAGAGGAHLSAKEGSRL